MASLKTFFITFVFLTWVSLQSFGQGCSDAGFCTINSLKPGTADDDPSIPNQCKIGIFMGKADNSIAVYGTYLEYNRQLTQNTGIDLKLTTIAQNGNNISVFGLSDAFVNANYTLNEKFKLTAGFKIPLSNASASRDNLPLPMDYQSSLGTLDLILGIGYEIWKIQCFAAIQQPLTQNDNRFIATDYPENSPLRGFQTTRQFKRAGDVMVRVSYPISLGSKFRITPGILPIYHLANDRYTDAFNAEKEIAGSSGLTLNGNLYFDYQINNRNALQLNLGMPFVVREARPDGLTRSFIMQMEYRGRF
jgi:hypothetical protein